MSPPKRSNLVLVEVTAADATFRFGTGYLLTRTHVLTAAHVLGEPGEDPPTRIRVRQESSQTWIEADPEPAWHPIGVDAVLISLNQPADDVEEVPLGTTIEADHQQPWESTGYPGVAALPAADTVSRNYATSGLDGVWYPHGGQGQLAKSLDRYLDLAVNSPPTDWHGVSGAPIVADGRLIGIIGSAPPDYKNRRLRGIPIEHIVQNPAFVATITSTDYRIPEEDLWFLVVHAENTSSATKGLLDSALTTLEGRRQNLAPLQYESVDVAKITIDINDELVAPGRWLRFTELLARAPIALFDVTKYEPAIMLALGVRAVARRGVTLTFTRDRLTESELSDLPFNIKETRLVSLNPGRPDGREGKDVLIDTVRRGLAEEIANSDYLDLPAYESVRCRRPPALSEAYAEFLVLCSFDSRYEPHWQMMRETIARTHPGHKGVRMLDIASPRLVGQALYEQIRWNDYCLADWTGWRPNVFFELGVRLACSRQDPVLAIHRSGAYVAERDGVGLQTQRDLLLSLFQPVSYDLDNETQSDIDEQSARLDDAFHRVRRQRRGEIIAIPVGVIPPSATYDILASTFYWQQERLLQAPDVSLRKQIEARIGADSQRIVGESEILFSSNPDFARALEESTREDWLAAWLYALGRSDEEPASIEGRAYLIDLAENVLQALSRSRSPVHQKMRSEIGDILDKWEGDELE